MELLIELVFQLVGWFFTDIVIHLFPWTARDRTVYFGIFCYALLGATIGALTLFAMPAHLIRSNDLRIANLIITPLVVAAVMAWIGAIRRKHDKRVVRMEEFVYAYAAALTFAMVRFFGAS